MADNERLQDRVFHPDCVLWLETNLEASRTREKKNNFISNCFKSNMLLRAQCCTLYFPMKINNKAAKKKNDIKKKKKKKPPKFN